MHWLQPFLLPSRARWRGPACVGGPGDIFSRRWHPHGGSQDTVICAAAAADRPAARSGDYPGGKGVPSMIAVVATTCPHPLVSWCRPPASPTLSLHCKKNLNLRILFGRKKSNSRNGTLAHNRNWQR
ncbi:uncharacterized protein CANTADRAFT_147648 [Suhomyces tanzawaensis NRRL Y-17324]|uniref:Uncharacterized protein n=1 Tax=Suhomyces tanzawaensis NRRL Y-17324 TaxID=984487 RepID=A0A1E4SAT3_9ASCO|nr:uncharacterized protein CANTADRAFT_147648 [Suhomyces tanzawaensis NRRL Y-17324]ODV76613.1 hypothetical protein CANTADRAFT_147648 [Suhomyces tanzawaensis NRRL Y-17324]